MSGLRAGRLMLIGFLLGLLAALALLIAAAYWAEPSAGEGFGPAGGGEGMEKMREEPGRAAPR